VRYTAFVCVEKTSTCSDDVKAKSNGATGEKLIDDGGAFCRKTSGCRKPRHAPAAPGATGRRGRSMGVGLNSVRFIGSDAATWSIHGTNSVKIRSP
jgi:hypothetical protein